MSMTQSRYAMPQYMQQFQCIGSACEDTCCAWWGISVDKRTYEQYRSIPDEAERERILSQLELKPGGNEQGYAAFKMNPDTGGCSMLSGGLCTIQAKHGEPYLSGTCSTYPRKVNAQEGAVEISALLSCPEAARLALLQEDGCRMNAASRVETPNLVIAALPAGSSTDANQPTYHYRAIRDAAIRVLQNRLYIFPHRLILLGLLCEQLELIAQEQGWREIPAFLASFEEELEGGLANNGELRDYAAFPRDSAYQIRTLNQYLMRKLEGTIWNLRYKACVADYMKGMTGKGDKAEQIVRQYDEAYAAHLRPFAERHDYFFENYAVNAVFGSFLAGMHQGQGIYEQYKTLVIDYAMIKLHLVGLAAHRGELTAESAVELVQCYTKNYEHAASYRHDLLRELAAGGRDTLNDMVLLITN
jgi:lysine-N-methylase